MQWPFFYNPISLRHINSRPGKKKAGPASHGAALFVVFFILHILFCLYALDFCEAPFFSSPSSLKPHLVSALKKPGAIIQTIRHTSAEPLLCDWAVGGNSLYLDAKDRL